MNLKECCDASVDAFGFVYEAIQGDKRFPEHLPMEAYVSAHSEAMKLLMTSIINEAKGKPFSKPDYKKQKEHETNGSTSYPPYPSNPCTETQAKAVFAITHTKNPDGKWKPNSNFIKLEDYGIINKDDIKNMLFNFASEFIEKYGK